MLSLPIRSDRSPIHRDAQPFSPQTQHKQSRLRDATLSHSVCPYCAVGCGLNVYTKAGKLIDIEGNPDSPINEGTLCPKGANSFQLAVNPHRERFAMRRAPYSERWERVPLEWALQRVAERVKDARDSGFIRQDKDGLLVNHVTNMGTLGGAVLDNEENYLMKKLFSAGLGMVSIENQARI